MTVKKGDAIFIPSGRIHAIGAGNVIVEVQQNSDTTYRVFDWNRTGLEGKPRALHLDESLASIDFGDIEPALTQPQDGTLVQCEYFKVERVDFRRAREAAPAGKFTIICVLEGGVKCGGTGFTPGDFFLVPAEMPKREMKPAAKSARVLRITLP